MQRRKAIPMTARKSTPSDDETVRKTTTIGVELSEELDRLAKERNVSVSWLISQAIRELVERARN